MSGEFATKLVMIDPLLMSAVVSEIATPFLDKPPVIVSNPSLIQVAESLLSSGSYSDFTLKVGTKSFKLHKCILATWDYYNHVMKYSDGYHEHHTEMPLSTFQKV